MTTAIQDTYPDDVAHCYGCGRENPAGHQLKTYWDGEGTVASFTPRAEHMAMPGYVYGGLIASLVDCHGTGSAAAAGYRAQDREPGSEPPLRYVTASLQVDYVAPTPMGVELTLRGTIEEVGEHKVVVSETVHAGETLVARGRVVAVLMPAGMARG
ncbi:PaaI family thioesterase [Janibacter anophelis]|uniref:PaaI family thioesterase n=1 Tax=Janibacter anophelis TaxID=319054 RepID=UPI000832702F|nr:PaaI family thioesterase [Janibacter anophelis]